MDFILIIWYNEQSNQKKMRSYDTDTGIRRDNAGDTAVQPRADFQSNC